MEHCKKILFPVDFSERSAAAAPYVRDMAERFAAEVIILHAFYVLPSYPVTATMSDFQPVQIPYTADFVELRKDRKEQLERFSHQHFPGVTYSARLEDGEPGTTIEETARRDNIDLIAMSTSGLGRWRRLLLGSLTAKVLHDVHCAVWTSIHAPEDGSTPTPGYRSILCAVDLDDEIDNVLRTGSFLAQTYGARLSAVHIESGHPGTRQAEADAEALQHAVNRALAAQVKPSVGFAGGTLADGIRNAAIREKADLVITGRGSAQRHLLALWSQLYTIIRESPCPVLSV
jgi:nucleotide-binding universal stress UspA family protein